MSWNRSMHVSHKHRQPFTRDLLHPCVLFNISSHSALFGHIRPGPRGERVKNRAENDTQMFSVTLSSSCWKQPCIQADWCRWLRAAPLQMEYGPHMAYSDLLPNSTAHIIGQIEALLPGVKDFITYRPVKSAKPKPQALNEWTLWTFILSAIGWSNRTHLKCMPVVEPLLLCWVIWKTVLKD